MHTITDIPRLFGRSIGGISVRAQLIIAFVVMIVLIVIAISSASASSLRQGLSTGVGTNIYNQAQAQANNVGGYIERQADKLRSFTLHSSLHQFLEAANARYAGDSAATAARLAERDSRWRNAPDSDPLIQQVVDNAIAADLRTYTQAYADVLAIIVIDRNGALVAASQRMPTYNKTPKNWWQQAWNEGRGATYIGLDERIDNNTIPTLTIAMPVYAADRKTILGVIRAIYRTDALLTQLEMVRVGATGKARVILPDNRLLNSRNLTNLDAGSITALDSIRNRPYATTNYQGMARIMSLVPVDTSPEVNRLGWALLLYQSEEEALALVDRTIWTGIMTAIAVSVVAILVALLLAALITAPLARMAQAARAIASGDFGQRIPFQGRNEIGRLAASFNAMAQAVETRRQAEQAAQAEQLRLQENIIQLQEATLKELAVPLITLADHVLLLPLIGTIDQRRSQQLITTLLAGVAQHRASQVILDMTGVTHMDEWSAANLGQLVQGCRLLGAEVALAGLRPHVANMLATTAIATSDITIFSSLHTATEALLKTE